MTLPGERFFTEEFRFPWRDGNQVSLLHDGTNFFPRMESAINRARHIVQLEFYLVESGAVVDKMVRSLCAACARGVHVQFLLDGVGARNLSRTDRKRLRDAGVQMLYYNPLRLSLSFQNLARDHRKLLLVDRRLAFVGGAGLSDVFLDARQPASSWRELMLEITGPVVRDWQMLFEHTWLESGGVTGEFAPQVLPSSDNGCRARVTCSRRLIRQEIRNSVLREIGRARTRVWISTAYFVPSWTIRRALRRAAGRGVDVILLLPGPVSDHPAVTFAGRRHYARLLRAGVRIFEYQPRFLHMKSVLVDDWVSVGSCNLDHWTMRWNLEANQEIRDAGVAAELAGALQKDLLDAKEITAEIWMGRSRFHRMLEDFLGWVDRMLSRIGN